MATTLTEQRVNQLSGRDLDKVVAMSLGYRVEAYPDTFQYLTAGDFRIFSESPSHGWIEVGKLPEYHNNSVYAAGFFVELVNLRTSVIVEARKIIAPSTVPDYICIHWTDGSGSDNAYGSGTGLDMKAFCTAVCKAWLKAKFVTQEGQASR